MENRAGGGRVPLKGREGLPVEIGIWKVAVTMLRYIAVNSFALIDQLEVEFQKGLNLITGETGSGKSILVDAVALLTGERASQESIRQGRSITVDLHSPELCSFRRFLRSVHNPT